MSSKHSIDNVEVEFKTEEGNTGDCFLIFANQTKYHNICCFEDLLFLIIDILKAKLKLI